MVAIAGWHEKQMRFPETQCRSVSLSLSYEKFVVV
jgi:hypothetical protein